MTLNSLLEWVPHPTIIYTLYEHPSTAFPDYRRANKGWCSEPATYPHSSHITIRVPSFDRPIVVHSTSSSFVTVQDILTRVRGELRNEVYHALCAGGAWGPYTAMQVEEDVQKGVMRVLRGRVMWDGLIECGGERDIWVLRVR